MIHVIAIITAKPGLRAAVLEIFRANVPAVLAEQGCIEYVPTIDSAPALGNQTQLGADAFVVVEKWETLADLEAHGKAPHMVAYGQRTKDIVAHRVIHILSPA